MESVLPVYHSKATSCLLAKTIICQAFGSIEIKITVWMISCLHLTSNFESHIKIQMHKSYLLGVKTVSREAFFDGIWRHNFDQMTFFTEIVYQVASNCSNMHF